MNISISRSGNSFVATSVNIWLAIGDETGPFENSPLSGLHGIGLILARPADLVAALNDQVDGKSIRWRMNHPIDGLEASLTAKGPRKTKELARHHVREAWEYFRDCGIKGQYQLDAVPPDFVLANLLGTFRWLAAHPNILSLGIHGSGTEILVDFWKGSDPMAAIGALYGRTLALVSPFLGASPQIRILPGRRSEEINAAAIRRAGQIVAPPRLGTSRQTTSNTGGNRTLLDAMENEFWQTLSAMGDQWHIPSHSLARKSAFAGYMDRAEFATALYKEDKIAANLIRTEERTLNNLADLACSLMAASCDSNARDLRIIFPDPIGPNVRFFSASEVLL
jgi:hypothetical protein